MFSRLTSDFGQSPCLHPSGALILFTPHYRRLDREGGGSVLHSWCPPLRMSPSMGVGSICHSCVVQSPGWPLLCCVKGWSGHPHCIRSLGRTRVPVPVGESSYHGRRLVAVLLCARGGMVEASVLTAGLGLPPTPSKGCKPLSSPQSREQPERTPSCLGSPHGARDTHCQSWLLIHVWSVSHCGSHWSVCSAFWQDLIT